MGSDLIDLIDPSSTLNKYKHQGASMRNALLLIPLLLLTSCASIPDTSGELVNSTDVKDTKCYSQDHDVVEKKVKDFLEGCYRVQTIIIPIAGIPVPMTSEVQVIEEAAGESKRYSVRSKYGIGISVDITPNTENCKTRVDMYALRSHLREKFKRIDDAINDKNPGCGIV